MPLTWTDAGALAELLHARFPRKDPLTLRFPDLEGWIRGTEGFVAERAATPAELEHIQAAWYARFSHELARGAENR